MRPHVQLGRLAEWGYTFARDDRGIIYRGALRGPDYMQIMRRRLLKLGVRLWTTVRRCICS